MSDIIRSEHPRPDRLRKVWCTLNGRWDFTFDQDKVGKKGKWYRKLPATHQIEVPFCYQSKLSGVDSQEHCDVVWYARKITNTVIVLQMFRKVKIVPQKENPENPCK